MSKKHKVVVLYPFFPLYRLGVFLQLNRSRDLDLTLAGSVDSIGDIKGFSNYHFSFFKFVSLNNIWFLNKTLLWQENIFSQLKNSDYSTFIILANPYHLSTWVFSVYLRLIGKRVIFWTHGIIKEEVGLKLIFRKLFLKIPNELFLYSHYSKDVLISHGFLSEKLHVIYNSVYNKVTPFSINVYSKNKNKDGTMPNVAL
jgi:hypothetical protein